MERPRELSSEDWDLVLSAMPAFVNDAKEQTQRIERLLLSLEGGTPNPGLHEELFRCAHSLKGSAGMFGVAPVVELMHHMEGLLEQLKQRQQPVTPRLATVLLQCNDLVRHYLAQIEQPDSQIDDMSAWHQHLVEQLQQAQDQPPPAAPAVAQAAPVPSQDAPPTRRWYLSLRFDANVFEQGMDPLAALAQLSQLGELVTVTCDRSAIPPLEALQPRSCQLAFGLCLETSAARSRIEAQLDPWRSHGELHVIESAPEPENFARLIEQMPDRPQLRDILLAIGAIPQPQLQATLHKQELAQTAEAEAPRSGEPLLDPAGVSPDVMVAALHKQQRQLDHEDRQTLRVQAHKLDALTQLLAPLGDASQQALRWGQTLQHPALLEPLQHIERLLAEMRQHMQSLRMQSLGDTFNQFRRLVRDAATQLGKEVVLDITGDEIEFDQASMSKISALLVHLVNNALDHGLERPAQRLAMGKPAQGILSLSAQRHATHTVISVIDDGRGFDRDKIRRHALQKGLIQPHHHPSDDEILKLVFQPGFSTASRVTHLSGRGVGLDVVMRNVADLGGQLTVQSSAERGTRIDLFLPSLAP